MKALVGIFNQAIAHTHTDLNILVNRIINICSQIIGICSKSQFNRTSAWCSHIEDHTNETMYTEVEREVSCDWCMSGTDIVLLVR